MFFQTGEALVAGDADGRCYVDAELYLACSDVYERFNATTTLVSTGPSANNGSFTARFRGRSYRTRSSASSSIAPRPLESRQALQFLFSQTWYLLWSVSMLVLWVAPLVALLADRRIAATTLSEYLVYFTPLPLAGWLMWFFARPWFKPHGVRISWRGVVLTVARWPVVLWALLSVLMRIKRPYMITPKGVSVAGMRPAIVALAPLFAFAVVALGGVWLSGALVHDGYGRSYALLVLINALIMVLASDTVLLLEMSRRPATDRTLRGLVEGRVGAFGWLVVLVGALATTTVVFWDSVRAAIS